MARQPQSQPTFHPARIPLAQRDALWNSHPVLQWEHRVCIPTPPLQRIVNVVSDVIYRRKQGRFFVGSPRFGKTQMIFYLIDWIGQTYPRVPMLYLEAALRQRSCELALYDEFLNKAGFCLPRKKRPYECLDQLVNLLWSMVAAQDEFRLIVFVDEAQHWTLTEWAWLKGIANRLLERRVSLIVVPFGQYELVHVGTTLQAAGREDLRQRFLAVPITVEGVVSEDELRVVLEWCDRDAEYPESSGWSYTEFFFPRAFAADWRLAAHSAPIWKAFQDAASSSAKPLSIGMVWVRGVIEFALLDLSARDAPSFSATAEDWAKAVAASDFTSAFGARGDVPLSAPL